MSFNTLSPSKSGVVFFDMLNAGFRGRTESDQRRMEPIVANCVRLRDAARQHDVALFYPKADHRPDGKDIATPYIDLSPRMVPWDDPEDTRRPHATNVAGNWGAQIIDELEPQPEDYVIPKHRWSSFFQTKLELSMRSRGIDTLILCGGSTEVGIASTSYAARDLDFDLVFVSDAITSGKPDVNEMFMTRIFPRMGRIRDTSQVIEMIAAGAAASE